GCSAKSTWLLKSLAAGIDRASGGRRPGYRASYILSWVEVFEIVVAFPCVRQCIVAQTDLQTQPGVDLPVVVYVSRRSVVDVVPDRQRLRLRVASGQTKQLADERIASISSSTRTSLVLAEGVIACGIGLQLL